MTSVSVGKKRFLAKIKKDASGCWLWTGATRGRQPSHLYGWVTFNKKQLGAHRLAWIFFVGEIPPGMSVCHKCDVPLCVNPDHLFLGTHAENMKDMHSKGRLKRSLEQPMRSWTADEDEVLRANYANVSAEVIAEQLGRSVRAIWVRANRLNVRKEIHA